MVDWRIIINLVDLIRQHTIKTNVATNEIGKNIFDGRVFRIKKLSLQRIHIPLMGEKIQTKSQKQQKSEAAGELVFVCVLHYLITPSHKDPSYP